MMQFLSAWWALITERDGQWHSYGVDQMRRWVGGAWQRRPMTEQEADIHWNETQW